MFSIPSSAVAGPLIDLANGKGIFATTNDMHQSDKFESLYTQDRPTFAGQPSPDGFKQPSRSFVQPVRLNLRNANIDEQLSLIVSPTLQLSEIEQLRLNHFLRDWREDVTISIDEKILKYLLLICTEHSTSANEINVHIASGYRSRKTNDMLRRRSHEVASNSMHTQGKAIDFYIPGISNRQLGATARKICKGGVGIYGSFVHIDSGEHRLWEA